MPSDKEWSKVVMSEENVCKILLKATLYGEGDPAAYLDRLVSEDRRAVRPIETCACGSKRLRVIYREKVIRLRIKGTNHMLRVLNIPHNQCLDCRKVTTHDGLMYKVSRTLKMECESAEAGEDALPDTIDLCEWLGIRLSSVVNLEDTRPNSMEGAEDGGKTLRMVMAEMDINASELAHATGISLTTISNLRNGRVKNPKRSTVEAVSTALGVTVESIWPHMTDH